MAIPCLCLFIALSSLFSELVGAKPLHLLIQTVLLLKHPTGVFVAVANPFFEKNRVRVRTVWWGVPAPNPAKFILEHCVFWRRNQNSNFSQVHPLTLQQNSHTTLHR